MKRTRRNYTAKFKAKVALEAAQERLTLAEIAQKYELHPNIVSNWKQALLEGSVEVFEATRGAKPAPDTELIDRLYRQIGQMQV